MGAFFDICMLVMLGIFGWAAVALVRRTRQRRSAWESGLTAQARVVRAWATTQMVNNVARRVQWHEYDYYTQDGRLVRFRESGGPRDRAEGELTLVYYAPHEPDKATASEPQPGKDAAGTAVWLTILAAGAFFLIYEWATLPGF
ncbi:DUF3592 domain-containing protein [Streptomyces sp. NPDC101151]|uniref:DUF3592 domain-containing protein n=1 Tax=Streptomyces sp. NPDC101151 TaxID=3366115 RepID=UPI0037F29084